MGGSGTLHSWSLKGGAKLLKGRPRQGSMKIHHQARMQRCQNDAIFKQTSQTKVQEHGALSRLLISPRVESPVHQKLSFPAQPPGSDP